MEPVDPTISLSSTGSPLDEDHIAPRTFPAWVDVGLILSFLVFLALPGLEMIFPMDPYEPPKENRALASRPSLGGTVESWVALPNAFDSYINDHVGFRNALIRWRNVLKYAVLGDTPSRKKVIVGKDGYFFDGHFLDICFYRGWAPDQHAEQTKILQSRNDWLKEQGIDYLVMLIPAAFSINSEFLPDHLAPLGKDARIEYAVTHFRENAELDVLDLRFRLNQEKKKQKIYQELDTHWNDIGAYAAYQELVRRLNSRFPSIKERPDSDFDFSVEERKGLFFNDALALPWNLTESYAAVKLKTPQHRDVTSHAPKWELADGTQRRLPLFFTEVDNPDLPKAVIFIDSFGYYFLPYLAEHFSRAVWVRQPSFAKELIEEEKPDVVISSLYEDNIAQLQGEWATPVQRVGTQPLPAVAPDQP